jgi:RNA polymerase sigma factor (sigma-70 family)
LGRRDGSPAGGAGTDAGIDAQIAAERAAVERLKAGDVTAIDALFERHADALLRRVIRPRLPDDAAAQDVLKETFLTAMRRIETFEWRAGGVGPWLRQIAVNKVTDLHRARKREERLAGAYQEYLEQGGLGDPDGAHAEAVLGDEEHKARLRARIGETLGALHPRYAEAIRLRLVDEEPRARCAAALSVTVATFDVILFRALKAFRKRWGGVREADDREEADRQDRGGEGGESGGDLEVDIEGGGE